MAFDVEGARKAGYTDAEIAGHLAQQFGFDLPGAKSAGYTDADVVAHLSARPKAAPIPGQEGEPARVAAAQANRPGLLDTAIGTGEAALSAITGGTTGFAGGLLSAANNLAGTVANYVAGNDVSGRPGADKAFAEGAQQFTYAPRTESGQEQIAAVGDFANRNLTPLGGMIAPITQAGRAAAAARASTPANVLARAGAEGVARDVANVVARPAQAVGLVAPGVAGDVAAGAVASGAAKVAGLAKTATTLPRRAMEALSKPQESAATPGTMGSVGAAGTDMAAIRKATAADLPVPVNNLTKGMLSRDPAQLKFEVETAKLPEAGKPLRDRSIEINQTLLANFDHLVDQSGAQAPSLRAVGSTVDAALVKRTKLLKGEIRARYKAAERAGQMEDPVAMDAVVGHLNDSAPSAAVAPLLNAARGHALKLGLAVESPEGVLVPQAVPLKTAELFRQAIGADTDFTPTNIRQATIIKSLVDQSTEGKGGSLYKVARAARAKYAQEFEDRAVIAKLVNTKRGMADRQVAFEDVFDHSVLKGSLDDVTHVRDVLRSAGADGVQAWRELQGATLRHIHDEATKSVALDSAGRRAMSPAALDKTIRVLDADGKLDFIFGKKQAQQLRDIREIAQIAKTVPQEAAINFSNTATTLMSGMADIAGFGMTGAPVPLMTLGRIGAKYIKDSRLRNRINDALNEQAKKQAPNRKRNAPPVQEPPPAATYH